MPMIAHPSNASTMVPVPSGEGPPGIAEQAESRLRGNHYLALKHLSCTHRDGTLTVRGFLPTYYLKQVALTVVSGIEGVVRVVDEIEVSSMAGGGTVSR